MHASAVRTARKLTALSTKQTPIPAVAMIAPAIAGPITREPLKSPAFRATAFGSDLGPTIWYVSDCRPGASKASVIPPSAAST